MRVAARNSCCQENGAQNYPQCFNLEVESSGSDEPAGVAGTSLYKADDAGIKFDLYSNPTSYPIPGPKLMSGGSSGSAPSTPATPSTGSGSDSPAPSATQAPAESSPAAGNDNNNGGSAPVETSPAAPQPTKTGCKAKKARRHARDMLN